jgi:hypothetical protein
MAVRLLGQGSLPLGNCHAAGATHSGPSRFGSQTIARFHAGLQRASRPAGDVREELFREALPGLAVGAGLGGARGLSPRQEVGEQAGDGGAAGVGRAQDLPQEDPQRDQRGEDPVQPAGDGGQRLREDLFREDVSPDYS